jgi:hypothetical protein
MWKYIIGPDRPQMTVWRMRIACWKLKTTNIPSEYVTISVFHLKNGCTTAPQRYATRTLLVLFCTVFSISATLAVTTNLISPNIFWICFHTGACPKTHERTLRHPPTEPISLCRFCPVIQVPFARMIKPQTVDCHETSTKEFNAYCCQRHVLLYLL